MDSANADSRPILSNRTAMVKVLSFVKFLRSYNKSRGYIIKSFIMYLRETNEIVSFLNSQGSTQTGNRLRIMRSHNIQQRHEHNFHPSNLFDQDNLHIDLYMIEDNLDYFDAGNLQ